MFGGDRGKGGDKGDDRKRGKNQMPHQDFKSIVRKK